MAVAALLGACGGGSSSDANEQAGTYHVKVTEASFPTDQNLGQTSLLRLGVRNSGDKTVPTLTVTVSLAGKQGSSSMLPFGVRDATVGVAQPDRPAWVLAAGYPKLHGSSDPGGASTSNPKTFALGPLKPGEMTDAVWKLTAVRQGHYTVLYRVGAGLASGIHAKTEGGVAPGGSFVVDVTSKLPETEVTDNGEVVEIKGNGSGGEKGE
ncbi:MAG: hypothetical protein ABW065_09600 [Solirubrobacterales bacterium]